MTARESAAAAVGESRETMSGLVATLTAVLIGFLLIPLSAIAGDVLAEPVPVPTDAFREVLVQVGDDLYIGGQPTEQGLKDMRALGVTTVVNLRTSREMDDRSIVPFDEAGVLKDLGMRYVHIPAGGPDTPYSPGMVDAFAAALTEARGKVLLHCTVAWRASHLYVAYLHRYAGLPLPDAVRRGRAINFGDLPLEGFLGQPLKLRVDDE